jgi:hypothetical protein
VNVTFDSGFSGTVTFQCTEPSTLTSSTCTVPPAINAAGQVSFSIATALPSASNFQPFERRTGILYAALLPGLLGIVLTAGSSRSLKSQRSLRLLGFILILGFSTLGLGSCGGTSRNSIPGTPKGTYTITVTGTSGSSTSTATFQLVVQ